MTYEELKARLTKCEVKLKEIQSQNSAARKSKNYNTAVEKLTLLKESLEQQLKEAEETMFVSTKGGDTKAVKMSRKQAMDLKRDPNVTDIDTAKGQDLKEEGVAFSKEETAAIAREVGKAVAKALHTSGDEVAHMKAKDIEPNSFEIYVQYKNDSDDQFSFYITDDTLHLQDFSFDKEIGDVGVKPSGEAIVHVDVLANELVKHFKSLAAEGMSDQEWADAKEADRLEKHPEKDTIKKIQALIAAQQKDESIFDTPRMGGFHNSKGVAGHSPNTHAQDKAYADSNRKAREKDDETIDEAPEGKSYIKVAVRDARKALNIIDDSPAYSKAVEIDGSDTYYLDDKELAYDLLMDLGAQDIEVTDSNVEDNDLDDYGRSHSGKDSHTRYSEEEFADMTDPLKRYARFNENESEDEGGDLDIGHQDDEPDMLKQYAYDIATYAAKLYKQLDKYDQMDAEVDFPNWWQSKVILAKDYISKAQHYLEFEEKQPAIDQLALEESVDESHAKLKREYDELVGKMKQLAKHFKTAEGEKKAKIVAALKQHTARKRELEGLIDQAVSGMGAGQELDELFGSKLNYDEIIGGIVKRFHELKKYVGKKEPDAMDDLEKVLRAFEIFDEKMAYGTHMELEQVSEAKATCCGKCGRVHVKGTKCKRPYLTGKDHCRYN